MPVKSLGESNLVGGVGGADTAGAGAGAGTGTGTAVTGTGAFTGAGAAENTTAGAGAAATDGEVAGRGVPAEAAALEKSSDTEMR